MKLWKKWKETVDAHNAKQTYVTHEEVWGYYDFLIPIVFAIITFGIITGTVFVMSGCTITLKQLLVIAGGSIVVGFLSAVFMLMNWIAYD